MDDVEIFMSEGGGLHVAQQHSLRSLLGRLQGSERHRVFTWPNCNFLPLDKVSNTKYLRSPDDDFFVRFLKAAFLFTLSMGVIKILHEQWMMWSLLIYPVILIAVAIVAAAMLAAPIVEKKTKNTDLTTPRKEEVERVCGPVQQV